MVLDYQYHQRLGQLHSILSNAIYPIQWAVDGPIRATRALGRYLKTHQHLVKQNEFLREQQFQQEGRLQRLLAIEAENAQLRSLLQASPRLNDAFCVAEILKIDSDPFNHRILINKGAHHGAYVGQPIADALGVVGVVIEVLQYNSRALLLTDASHAVPVETIRNGVRGIAEGVGSVNHLQLQYVPTTADIVVGDVLVTSGLGGRFPSGYPVGVVEAISQDSSKSFASIRIKPSANLDRGRQVLMIQNQTKVAQEEEKPPVSQESKEDHGKEPITKQISEQEKAQEQRKEQTKEQKQEQGQVVPKSEVAKTSQ